MIPARLFVVTVTILATAVFLPAPGRAEDDAAARLVEQLGDKDALKRDAAERALVEMGADALMVLEKAKGSDDPEVSMRARRAFEAVAHPAPEAQKALRDQGQEAFRNADYVRMALMYRRLSAVANATLEDRLWAGHGWQLAGEWRKAADAYHVALKGWKPDPEKRGDDETAGYKLGLLIARIEARELHDPAAAVKTITDTLASLKEPAVPVGANFDRATGERMMITIDLLQALADAQERLGDLKAALATWARLDEFCRVKIKHYSGSDIDIDHVARLLDRFPPDQPRPDYPTIFMLTPDKPDIKLMLDDEATRRRSCRPAPSPGPFWEYAFAPPPGKEFDTLEFACDIEQLQLRFGGHFHCFVMTEGDPPARLSLGDIGWPNDKPLGREVREATFDVPPGARLVRIETGSAKGAFNVYSVDVNASFREATKDAKPLRAQVGGWIQTELYPKGGKLTCGERVLQSERAYADFKPGRYHVRYEVAGREETFETDLDLGPAARSGIFVNLDSPFRWTQAPLVGVAGFAPVRSGLEKSARTTLAQLPDRSWLAAFCAPDDKIGISRSKDLVTWEGAELPPFNSIFENLKPSLLAASDGTVWLLYLSKRLSLPDWSSAGYSLWLTSTRDGRTWTPLRAVSAPGIGDMFTGPQMLQRRDGTCWVFWHDCVASAKSFAEIRELGRFTLAQPAGEHVGVSAECVVEDDAALLHMVFTCNGHEVFHATSRDGLTWEATKRVLTLGPDAFLNHPKAVFQGSQAALFFSLSDGSYVVPLRLDGRMLTRKDCVKITNHVIPMEDSPPMLTKDGDVLLVVGKETPWLLRAKLKDLAELEER